MAFAASAALFALAGCGLTPAEKLAARKAEQ